MAITGTAFSDNVLNYSGRLSYYFDGRTKFMNAIMQRGRPTYQTKDIEFALSVASTLRKGEQPAITEASTMVAAPAVTTTRSQKDNCIQLWRYPVEVSALKQSSRDRMSGLNTAGQQNNIPNEILWQAEQQMKQATLDYNWSYINGVYHKSTGNTDAWKSRGILQGIATNNVAVGGILNTTVLNTAIATAIGNGFIFDENNCMLWCNPFDLSMLTDIIVPTETFRSDSRTLGGRALRGILLNEGILNVDTERDIPQGTVIIVNMSELGNAEMDWMRKNENLGTWTLAPGQNEGLGDKWEIYHQGGFDYGAEQMHIKLTGITNA